MGYIAGRKSDESLVEVLIKRPEWTVNDETVDIRTEEILNTPEKLIVVAPEFRRETTGLKTVIPHNYGGKADDYSFHKMTENEQDRVKNGDSYEFTWTDNELTGIDFALEDDKQYIKVYADKTEIDGDGIEEAQITFEIWKTDKTSIDTSVGSTIKIPVLTPIGRGRKWIKVSIVNGTVTMPFKSIESGAWIFLSEFKRFGNLRVFGNRLEIEVIATDII